MKEKKYEKYSRKYGTRIMEEMAKKSEYTKFYYESFLEKKKSASRRMIFAFIMSMCTIVSSILSIWDNSFAILGIAASFLGLVSIIFAEIERIWSAIYFDKMFDSYDREQRLEMLKDLAKQQDDKK